MSWLIEHWRVQICVLLLLLISEFFRNNKRKNLCVLIRELIHECLWQIIASEMTPVRLMIYIKEKTFRLKIDLNAVSKFGPTKLTKEKR